MYLKALLSPIGIEAPLPFAFARIERSHARMQSFGRLGVFTVVNVFADP